MLLSVDFGTSNTTLGHTGPDGPTLLPLEEAHRTIPRAIFFELGRDPVIVRLTPAQFRALSEKIDGAA